ncbi:glycosyl hydrolase 115 family protein [Bacteroides ilei]|uniref:glycosyl hydrolase 115 family protein n=1 Tax=Bacteroides ilei TaxID=1907658 RepID=UPI0009304F1B|nr:glycosyl hydrolase 115 family protein [Bacteroides ilei]
MKKILSVILGLFLLASCTNAGTEKEQGITVTHESGKDYVDLTKATVVFDKDDWNVVRNAARLFASDVNLVTEKEITLQNDLPTEGDIVLIGTIGKSKWIDQLAADKKINVSAIKNGWEQFIITTLEHPFKGVAKALVIAGSDRRGTAYGVFSVSEAIGVSPWYWWADVPVVHQNKLFVKAGYTSETPSIKYRGIFINDEDWGMKPWSEKNFEKELGDIGPKTYAKVCELILRLKGNMLAPAMHTCTGPFYSYPDSKKVADEYGIMITTSHCEPLLFNNASLKEWDSSRDGDWNYKENRETIYNKLDNRVKEASPYENIYTLAMRGLHDAGMRGNLSDQEKVQVLAQAIRDQREILTRHIDRPIQDIPQIFIPYKEALDLYELGLEVPDDVTLVWVDDNYGYIKRLSNPEEQKRSGRAGVYYHTSYLGAPHDYLWLNTTPPVLMYEELKKAYDTGADRYWLLNVGDIKPMELATSTFFEMAWDFDRFNYDNVNKHQAALLGKIFGSQYIREFQDLLDEYYRLAWSRKPEFMGWEREWDEPEREKLQDTNFSFENHNDARHRIADYRELSDKSAALWKQLPETYRPAFFEMFAYPAMASYQMNRKFLMAQLNHELLKKNDIAGANWAALESQTAYDSIQALNKIYNTQLDGKWNYMMDIAPGFCARYQGMPDVTVTKGIPAREVDIRPQPEQDKVEGFKVLDLADYKEQTTNQHTLRLIKGLGYDWKCIQLGEATEPSVDPKSKEAPYFEYELGEIPASEITVIVHAIPFFPLYQGKSNCFGVSVDNSDVKVFEQICKEYSLEWKNRVLQNGIEYKTTFPIDPSAKQHRLRLSCGDPGAMIQRIIIDWGGLRKTYVGPQPTND